MIEAGARVLDVSLEVVDSNGLLPLAAAGRDFHSAAHFRRYVQKELIADPIAFPTPDPLARWPSQLGYRVPKEIATRWPRAAKKVLTQDDAFLASLPIDHEVPVSPMRGGSLAARKALSRFVASKLRSYPELHNEPSTDGTSRLSPYLHFGHVSAHEIAHAVMRKERWSPDRLAVRASGARSGFWGMSEGAEAFLDQLVVWRELGYSTCARSEDYGAYEALPRWAKETLAAHLSDVRPRVYTRRQFEEAKTYDPIWNAAQRQLRREGWQHNYMRMLWGKKILEWSKTPRAALATMTSIMNRWSLDGRNPNSYTGYSWTLGRYDRPWPERAIYGKVRSMSSDRTAAKVDLTRYLEDFADDGR